MNGTRRDEGSALILVLVLMVVGSMIVLPLLSYGITVTRANSVLSDKTKRQEAVKAGLRIALADPSELYRYCADESESLPMLPIGGIALETRCDFLAYSQASDDDDLHFGVSATKVGELIPDELRAIVVTDAMGNPVTDPETGELQRHVFQNAATTTAWLDPALRSALSQPLRIWAPNLPVHALNPRSPVGYGMPEGYATCEVYFPGTYPDPVELSGPVYFTSGIYYFEDVVTIAEDADVVVGMGRHEGCTSDQEAAFYAVDVPAPHNISGLGGTFVLGADARLVVSNELGSPSIRFNQRYVHETDVGSAASFGVSIVSVNGVVVGEVDVANNYTLGDLVVENVVEVPGSLVGGVGLPGHDDLPEPPEIPPAIRADAAKYLPSTLTHQPRPPSEPLAVTGVALRTGTGTNDGAARVEWEAPDSGGGLPITQYLVTASPGGQQCAVDPEVVPLLECIVTGLTHNTVYTFTVAATNDIGTSLASDSSGDVRPRTSGGTASPTVAAPAAPLAPQVARYADDTVEVTWAAPSANHATITHYVVASNPPTECVLTSTTSCIVRDLPAPPEPPDPPDPMNPPEPDVEFRVSAVNQMGTSTASPAATPTAAPGDSPPDPEPEPEAVVPAYRPDPIVEIDLPTTNAVVVDIPGYVAVPQGIFRLHNPHGLGTVDDGNDVLVSGGILAAAFEVVDGRANSEGELTAPIGLVNPIVQRTYMITTRTMSGPPEVTSRAVVQVNQNGGYAVNSWEVQ